MAQTINEFEKHKNAGDFEIDSLVKPYGTGTMLDYLKSLADRVAVYRRLVTEMPIPALLGT
jgi:hypothetical protein